MLLQESVPGGGIGYKALHCPAIQFLIVPGNCQVDFSQPKCRLETSAHEGGPMFLSTVIPVWETGSVPCFRLHRE